MLDNRTLTFCKLSKQNKKQCNRSRLKISLFNVNNTLCMYPNATPVSSASNIPHLIHILLMNPGCGGQIFMFTDGPGVSAINKSC